MIQERIGLTQFHVLHRYEPLGFSSTPVDMCTINQAIKRNLIRPQVTEFENSAASFHDA